MTVSVFDPHVDLAYSRIDQAPSPPTSGTTLTVRTGQGSRFGGSGPFWIVVWPQNSLPTPDVATMLRVVSIAGDVLTLDRARDRYATRTIQVGDQITAPLTAEAVALIEQAVNALQVASAQSPQVFSQSEASRTWTINHNLGRSPVGLTVFDSSGQQRFAQIGNPSANSTTVEFINPVTGSVVYL